MKKAVLFLIMFFAICIGPSYSHTLKGEVTYTVERARKEAFTNVEYSLPQSIIDKNIKDPNFKENIKAIKLGATELKDRYITAFSSGDYAIIYKNNLYYEYYYLQNGQLESIGKRNSLVFPVIAYRYNSTNDLISVSLDVGYNNTYIFDANGKLDSHWIGDKCYDSKGKLVLTRQ